MDTITSGFDLARRALLPDGFRDQLFPAAEEAAGVIAAFHSVVLSEGYDLVSPPLVEYEASLLAGTGATADRQMFRVMDTETQKIMALRSDMTTQVARLAATRLGDAPRPIRLAYAGEVARVKGSMLRPTRQFLQAGVELVGHDSPKADLEIIQVMVRALEAMGLSDLTLDMTCAPLVDQIMLDAGLDAATEAQARDALATKDKVTLDGLAAMVPALAVCADLLAAVGPGDKAAAALSALTLSPDAAGLRDRLVGLYEALTRTLPSLAITIDPCETKGFEYKTGVGFAIFKAGGTGELGRGGRYQIEKNDGAKNLSAGLEDACGFSLYGDRVIEALTSPSSDDRDRGARLYVATDLGAEDANKLRSDGFRLVRALDNQTQEEAITAAKAQRCSFIWWQGRLTELVG